jgi:hypothetical protein
VKLLYKVVGEDIFTIPIGECLLHIFQEENTEPFIVAVCGTERSNRYHDARWPFPSS